VGPRTGLDDVEKKLILTAVGRNVIIREELWASSYFSP
jgi:hypothetical protein